jgi:L-amino acid N-acyltransferase YncA
METMGYPKTVRLKDGRSIQIRPLAHDDFDKLLAFFQALSEEDRLFLRHDVRDPELIRKWTEELDHGRVLPVVALDCDEIVADGSLHVMNHGWTQHVGHLRLVTARTHRHKGLGGLVARELVALAERRGLEKLQAQVIEDNVGAVRMLAALGFATAAILEGMVRDQKGNKRNLAIMVNDVSTLSHVLESWIQDSMIPAYRVPGGGA